MNRSWEKEYTLRGSDFDKFGQIKPSSVLDLFQDAAGQHAYVLGVGFAQMLEKSYLWVLTRIKFRVLQQPKKHQTLRVKTWPLAPNRLLYRREYCITDLQGNTLIAGSSEWVVMHSIKRRFVSAPDLYPFTEGFLEDRMCEEKLGKVTDFEATAAPYSLQAGFGDLDVNDHVNNARYASFVMDALCPTCPKELDVFQIDFRKEVLLGDTLHIHHTTEGNLSLVKGLNDKGETTFACQLDYKA